MFQCVELEKLDDSIHEKWQVFDYSIDCTTREYKLASQVAWMMFIVYPVGVPCFAMYVFWKNWARLHGMESAPVTRQHNSQMSEPTKIRQKWYYGDRTTFYFMVRDYKPHVFYFEIIEFTRKFGLTGLLMLGAKRGSASQIVMGIMVAFVFGLLVTIVQPYSDPRANIFRILMDTSLFITLQIMLVLHFAESGELYTLCELLGQDSLQWILIVINFVLIIVAANQEAIFRAWTFYFQINRVGILYDPDDMLPHGTGDHGTIYRGQYKESPNADPVPAAIKVRGFDPSIEAIEAALMLKCEAHPNIVKLFKAQRDGPASYVAMELGELSLEAAVVAAGDIDAIGICKAIVTGVQHMHKSGFVHGNVTPANVILIGGRPKLSGFSCAQILEPSVATRMNTVRGKRGYVSQHVCRHLTSPHS